MSLFLALGLMSWAWGEEEWPEAPARLSLIEGQVAVQMAGSSEAIVATSNLPLGPGDRIWITGHGRAEVQLPAGNTLRLGDEANLQLGAFAGASAGAVPTRLERGMTTCYIRRLHPGLELFQVDLPQGSIRASVPSTFRADLYPDGSAQVSVHTGEVVVQIPDGIIEVRNRQTLRLSPGLVPQLYALATWDEFDRWNDLRDIQLSRASHARHLPAELGGYAPDFLAYGHWVPVPEYGYGWVPTVEVGWSPFRQGQWIWWRGELVWLSFEPWGWVPYHYGRWLFYPVIGWVWIPPGPELVIWNPGAVAWITGPEFVAWIPLAPGEIFFGFRDFGPGSVNITQVQVTNIRVTNVFVNTRATNAVVVVHKNTFLSGGRASASFIPPKDVFAAGGRRSVGPPPVRPTTVLLQRVPSKPMSLPTRRGPEILRGAASTTRGPEVGTTRGKPVLSPAEGPAAAEVKRAVPHAEVHQRRLTPEIMLRSSPPPPPAAPMQHRGARAGELRLPQEPRAGALSAPRTPHEAVHPAHGRRGESPPSPQASKGHPHPEQAGGR